MLNNNNLHIDYKIQKQPLFEAVNLHKYYVIKNGFRRKEVIKAVDGISIGIDHSETIGLVGESGCGKSTFGNLVLRLEKPTCGKVVFDGEDITLLDDKALRKFRQNIQAVFQDSYSSLNPRLTVEDIIKEPLLNFKVGSKEYRDERIKELLEVVGVEANSKNRYPHELSGGQRQRISIARALAVSPKLVVCDEPTASLDVSIHAQILNLMVDLRKQLGISYLFISHDIAAVKYISHVIVVMYLGKIVEIIESNRLMKDVLHPYTKALLDSIPTIVRSKPRCNSNILSGEASSPYNAGCGCKFYPRCTYAKEICREIEPQLVKISKKHQVACHLVNVERRKDD